MVVWARGLARRQPAASGSGHPRLSGQPALAVFPLDVQLDALVRGAHRPCPTSPSAPFTPFLRVNGTQHAFLIFVICMAVLFLPKVLALVDLALDAPRRRAFGGMIHATVRRRSRKRPFPRCTRRCKCSGTRNSSPPRCCSLACTGGRKSAPPTASPGPQALRQHWMHTAIGLVWGTAIWRLDQPTFWWFAPVVAGMVLSIPLSVLTSRASLGEKARHARAFLDTGRNGASAGIGRSARAHGQAGGDRDRRHRARRIPAWRTRCWTHTSTPSTFRCCGRSGRIRLTPRRWPTWALAARKSARYAKNC